MHQRGALAGVTIIGTQGTLFDATGRACRTERSVPGATLPIPNRIRRSIYLLQLETLMNLVGFIGADDGTVFQENVCLAVIPSDGRFARFTLQRKSCCGWTVV